MDALGKMLESMDQVLNILRDHEKRILKLEGKVVVEPPIEPPVEPPTTPAPEFYYEIDLEVSNHIDFSIQANQTLIIRFRFRFNETEDQSYTHITADVNSTGPCLRFALPHYGYNQEDCHQETSEGFGTDDTFTSWVVRRNEYIYLHVINESASGLVRLTWNKESVY